jgi:hypothetical protein
MAAPALRQQANNFHELTVYPETAPKPVETMVEGTNGGPSGDPSPSDVKRVLNAILDVGDGPRSIVGRQAVALSPDEKAQFQSFAYDTQHQAIRYEPPFLAALEHTVAVLPSEQRADVLEALATAPTPYHLQFVPLAVEYTEGAAQASVVANTAALTGEEFQSVFTFHDSRDCRHSSSARKRQRGGGPPRSSCQSRHGGRRRGGTPSGAGNSFDKLAATCTFRGRPKRAAMIALRWHDGGAPLVIQLGAYGVVVERLVGISDS